MPGRLGADRAVSGSLKKDWIGFKVRDFLMNFLTDEEIDTDEYMCHQTRPVLLPTGWADIPYPWHPSVVDIGIYQIGNFYILSVPGEFTTMAGRILRDHLREIIRLYEPDNEPIVTIAGLSNLYTHYITTPEEYDAQFWI